MVNTMDAASQKESSTTPPVEAATTRKQRKAQRKLLQRLERDTCDRLRQEKRASMVLEKSQLSLMSFLEDPGMTDRKLIVAQQLDCALWDRALLLQDALRLLHRFDCGVQFGDTHQGKWKTLNLRSFNGAYDNDSPAATGEAYHNTPCWAESTYIVPQLLASCGFFDREKNSGSTGLLPSTSQIHLERVRLSCIPADCNVAWHCDFEPGNDHCCRLHIPILCSKGFSLNIGGQTVLMNEGTSWIGNFELPHRLGNKRDVEGGSMRIHLIVDMLITPHVHSSSKLDSGRALFKDQNNALDGTHHIDYILGDQGLINDVSNIDDTTITTAKTPIKLDDSAANYSLFEKSLRRATRLLFDGDESNLTRRAACIAAFNRYRWANPDTVATRAIIEAGFYQDSSTS